MKDNDQLTVSAFPRALRQSMLLLGIAVVLALAVNALRGDGIPLVADRSSAARLAVSADNNGGVSLEEAMQFYQKGGAIFVDARSPEQYMEGHIAGALNVPWQETDDPIGPVLEKVTDPRTVIITYCDGEACTLGEELAEMLREVDYENVRVLINGWTLWCTRGYPTEKGSRS